MHKYLSIIKIIRLIINLLYLNITLLPQICKENRDKNGNNYSEFYSAYIKVEEGTEKS